MNIAYNIWMPIKETVFEPPIPATDLTSRGVQKLIQQSKHRRVITHYANPGDYEMTDRRWNKVTHSWNLKVTRNGTGILYINPLFEESAIMEVGIPGEFRQVTNPLGKNSRPCVLMGNQNMLGRSEHLIFKMLEYVPDNV